MKYEKIQKRVKGNKSLQRRIIYWQRSDSYENSDNSFCTLGRDNPYQSKDGTFNLLGKRVKKADVKHETILIYATEMPIERHKRCKKTYYSGKRKRHTIKLQVIVNKANGIVICNVF